MPGGDALALAEIRRSAHTRRSMLPTPVASSREALKLEIPERPAGLFARRPRSAGRGLWLRLGRGRIGRGGFREFASEPAALARGLLSPLLALRARRWRRALLRFPCGFRHARLLP